MLIKIKDIYLKIENIIWFSNNINNSFPKLNKKVYYANKLNEINDFNIAHTYNIGF